MTVFENVVAAASFGTGKPERLSGDLAAALAAAVG